MSCMGTRVLRGPDWDYGDVDGGEGCLGTVTEVLMNHEVRVTWDNGNKTTCRTGPTSEGKFDLLVYDTAQVGVFHPHTTCSHCGEVNIRGVLWRCKDCIGCDLCSSCYSADQHYLYHQFLRIDRPLEHGVLMRKRKVSVKIRAIGIFPGAKVKLSKDRVGDNDFCNPDSKGVVESFDNTVEHSNRSMVRIRWENGNSSSCRLGFSGHVDLTCVEEEAGGFYYRDHLPKLDTTQINSSDKTRQINSPDTITEITSSDTPQINTSDKTIQITSVRTTQNDSSDKTTQNDSSDKTTQNDSSDKTTQSDSSDKTTQNDSSDKTCSTSESNDSADVCPDGVLSTSVVLQEEAELTGTASAGQLTGDMEYNAKGDCSFSLGDQVAIGVGEETLRELQQSFGGTTVKMLKNIGKAGHVIGLTSRGAVTVKFDSSTKLSYRLNPSALVKVFEVKEGDTVRIRSDLNQVQLFNAHIGWKEEMRETLNKSGRVVKVDADRNVEVSFGPRYWFAPACCVPAPDTVTDTIVSGNSPGVNKSRMEAGHSSSTGAETSTEKVNKELFRKVQDIVRRGAGMRSDQMHMLYKALLHGDERTVRDLCTRDTTLVERELQGNITPLELATHRGECACVLTLLELGADVNRCAGSDRNKTPLTAAMEGKHMDLAELLLERGANPNQLHEEGRTMAHIATCRDQSDILSVLAKHGADLNIKDNKQNTPLHLAIERKRNRATETLVASPQVDLDATDRHNFTMIQLACYNNNSFALSLILARDKSGVNKKTRGQEYTPLHIAVTNDFVDCIRILIIDGGADVNVRSRKGLSPLHHACIFGNILSVETLLELGADVNVVDVDGDTPLHLTIGCEIEGYGKTQKAEMEVACRVQIATMLMTCGAFIDSKNHRGQLAFELGHSAVRTGVKKFMENNKHILKLKEHGMLGTRRSPSSKPGHSDLKERLKGVGLPCSVCGTPKSDVTLQPCQHKCVCSACCDKVTRCPLCDEAVQDRINTGPDEQSIDVAKVCKQM